MPSTFGFRLNFVDRKLLVGEDDVIRDRVCGIRIAERVRSQRFRTFGKLHRRPIRLREDQSALLDVLPQLAFCSS